MINLPEKTERELLNNDLQDFLDKFASFFDELGHTAKTGADLHRLNIKNEWGENVKRVINEPVKSNFDALRSIEDSIIQMIHQQFYEFLKTKKHLVKSAYRVQENSLHYVIILHENNFENEGEIIEFKMDYEDTPVSDRFPLILSFPKEEHLKGAKLDSKINFGERS